MRIKRMLKYYEKTHKKELDKPSHQLKCFRQMQNRRMKRQ